MGLHVIAVEIVVWTKDDAESLMESINLDERVVTLWQLA